MKFHQLFLSSFYSPKKLAAFRILPIGKVIRYVFAFILLLTAASFIRFAFGDSDLFIVSDESHDYIEAIGGLIYPLAFVFQFVISTFYVFVRVSLFACAGVGIAKLMKRRVEYRHMWRTAAVSITVPLLLTIIFDMITALGSISIMVTSVIHLLYISLASKYYPKLPR